MHLLFNFSIAEVCHNSETNTHTYASLLGCAVREVKVRETSVVVGGHTPHAAIYEWINQKLKLSQES